MKFATVIVIAAALLAVSFAADEAAVAAKLKERYKSLPPRAFDVHEIPRAGPDAGKVGVAFFAKGSKEAGRAVFFRAAVLPVPHVLVARFQRADKDDADTKPSGFAAALGLIGLVEYVPSAANATFEVGTSVVLRRIFVRRAFSQAAEWTRTLTKTTVGNATVHRWEATRTGAEGAVLTIVAELSTEAVEITTNGGKQRTVPTPNGFELTFSASNLPYNQDDSQWAWVTAVTTRSRPATDAAAEAVVPEVDASVDSEELPLEAADEAEDSIGGELRYRRTITCVTDDETPLEFPGIVVRSKFRSTFPRGAAGTVEDDAATTAEIADVEADLAEDEDAANKPGFMKGGKTNFVVHSVICQNAEGVRFQPNALIWDPTLNLAQDDQVSAAAALVPSVMAFVFATLLALLML